MTESSRLESNLEKPSEISSQAEDQWFNQIEDEQAEKPSGFENIQEKLFEIIESEEVEDVVDLNEKFLS